MDCLVRLRWAKTPMTGLCFAWMLAAFCFYIYISPVHVIIYKNVVPACLQNTSGLTMLAAYFCKICIRLAASRMQISFSRPQPGCKFHCRPLSGCKFHSVGCQLDANCIRLAAMQYKIPSLHMASDQPNEICILLATSWMQILQK
jgi:hypothetical protein